MPTPSTYQNVGMLEYDGRSPGLDASGFISDIAYKVRIKAKAASYTVNINESGTVFTTRGAVGTIVFTLPAASTASGCIFFFFNCVDQTMTISATAGEIITKNDVAANSISFATATELIGSGVMVCCDGTSWLPFIMAEETVTVTVAT